MFTDKEHRGPFAFSEELGNLSISTEPSDGAVAAQRVEANDKDLLLGTSEKEETHGYGNNGSAYSAPSYNASTTAGASQGHFDLVSIDQPSTVHPPSSFAIDDLLGLGMPAAPSSAPAPSPLLLNAKAAIDANAFQQKWRQLPVSLSQVCKLQSCLFTNMLVMRIGILVVPFDMLKKEHNKQKRKILSTNFSRKREILLTKKFFELSIFSVYK